MMVKGHFIPIHQVSDHLVVQCCYQNLHCGCFFCFVNLELDNFIRELDSREKRKNLFKKSTKQSTPIEGNIPKDALTWAV